MHHLCLFAESQNGWGSKRPLVHLVQPPAQGAPGTSFWLFFFFLLIISSNGKALNLNVIIGKPPPWCPPQKSYKKSKDAEVWMFQTCTIQLIKVDFLDYLQLFLCVLCLPKNNSFHHWCWEYKFCISTCYLSISHESLPFPPANVSVSLDCKQYIYLSSEAHLCLRSVKHNMQWSSDFC